MNNNILQSVKNAYKKLPSVGCVGCGECCVSPTLFLSEFIYLIVSAKQILNENEFKNAILAESSFHDIYDDNLKCPFLNNNKCTIHPGRAGACRLFGIPAMNELGINNMVKCRNDITVTSGKSDTEFIKQWVLDMENLERTLYPYDLEPYFMGSVNIQCWLDIYFDDSLDFDVFIPIKKVMNEYFDLTYLSEQYKPTTNIKNKLDKITILSTIIGSNDVPLIKKILLSIKNDYPKTGTYFLNVAESFLGILEERKKE